MRNIHTWRAHCAQKLVQFKSFAASSKITFWWLTLGDLLAVHRGRVRPIPWEHDVDICITPEQYPLFEKALRSNASYFQPKAEFLESGHCYLPIDMAKLGLTTREAEGVNVDIWTCPQLSGSIKRVLYCNDFMNVPGSLPERHAILSKHYGNYSTVKYAHHATMCRIWNGWLIGQTMHIDLTLFGVRTSPQHIYKKKHFKCAGAVKYDRPGECNPE